MKIEIENLTIKEAREISAMFGNIQTSIPEQESTINSMLIGKCHIFRTYSAGAFFGELVAKEGGECIISQCRRLYYWKTKGGISLSEAALTGLDPSSKVCAKTENHWISAIELIPCTQTAIDSIKEAPDYDA